MTFTDLDVRISDTCTDSKDGHRILLSVRPEANTKTAINISRGSFDDDRRRINCRTIISPACTLSTFSRCRDDVRNREKYYVRHHVVI